MITHHTQLINHLITRYGLKSYCEVGINNPDNNFHKIICEHKIGCDPAVSNVINVIPHESDYFFKYCNTGMFDCIFLDGLHHADQVQRDFNNSLRCLNDNGFIIIHDTCPDEEQYTIVPRTTRKWFGNVYKFAMGLSNYPGIGVATLDIDCGITIVWKDESNLLGYSPRSFCWGEDWNSYIKHRAVLLNIIPPADIDKYLPDVKATA